MSDVVHLRVDPSLRVFIAQRCQLMHGSDDLIVVLHDGTSTLGHLIQSTGVPLTEVGKLCVGTRQVEASLRDLAGRIVDIRPPARPQQLQGWPRFLLDVHLGSLARRLRLLGVDTSYSPSADDDELVELGAYEDRILLTKDRGILRRRVVLGRAAYVRGLRADEQVVDVLDRFRPPLAPWKRCVACNAEVQAVTKAQVVAQLQPGTARSYECFSRCSGCGRIYWRGAHAFRLDAAVAAGKAARIGQASESAP